MIGRAISFQISSQKTVCVWVELRNKYTIVEQLSLKKRNYCAYCEESMKLSEITSHAIMIQTWYGTHLAVTLFDLGEVIKGQRIKIMNKKSWNNYFWLQLYETLMAWR